MNTFVGAMDSDAANAVTENGSPAYTSTLNACVDLFAKIGSKCDDKVLLPLVEKAFNENEELATKVVLWGYDIREGAGWRQNFYTVMSFLEKTNKPLVYRIIPKIPELGRWDGLLIFTDPDVKLAAFEELRKGLVNPNTRGLAAKWTPRKGSVANEIRRYLGMSPKAFRKALVEATDVVETKMCDRQWTSIDYSKVPSVAGQRYKKAFARHDTEGYLKYISAVQSGEKKINTSTLFPHDVIRGKYPNEISAADQVSWDNLPEYYDASKNKILTVIDVSGSMGTIVSGSVSAMDISTALGIYTAQRNSGPFANKAITFHDHPSWLTFGPSLKHNLRAVNESCGTSTNLEAVFDLILKVAKENNVSQEDMPNTILIVSDMEFNVPYHIRDLSNHSVMEKKYKNAGYEKPTVIYWNVVSRTEQFPAINKDKVALVSGYSPAVLRSVLTNEVITPEQVMLDTVNKERYSV